jgi:hypothetical protein
MRIIPGATVDRTNRVMLKLPLVEGGEAGPHDQGWEYLMVCLKKIAEIIHTEHTLCQM